MTISKLTGNIQPLDEVDKINEIIDGALENAGTGTNALAIMGTATGNRGVGIGQAAEGSGAYASGLGTGAKATGNYAIQIGYGTNSTASSLNIGFNASSSANRKNWQLLDGTTGLIPDARLSSNIARTTDIVSRNIGEIVASTIPLTDAGLHLLDGSLIQGGGIYSAFVDYIAGLLTDYPNLFCTEANWQSAVTQYGVCGKFVYDSVNNTVRLPKYSNKIYTKDLASTIPVVGNGMALGFDTGITSPAGYEHMGLRIGDSGTFTGLAALTGNYGKNVGAASSGSGTSIGRVGGVTTDGSKSGIIADLSNITTSLEGYYYIVIATSTKTDIEVDIDEIATDLNGKADVDLSNVNDVGTSKVAGWAMPSDTYEDLTLGSSGATYTAPANGYIFFQRLTTAAGQTIALTGRDSSNNALVAIRQYSQASGNYLAVSIPVRKGSTYQANYTAAGTSGNYFRFIYAKGSESEAS